MVKFISSTQVLPLRSLVLRNEKPLELCVFDGDHEEGVFHLGYFLEDEIVSIVSFMPKGGFENEGTGVQLRGMATHPNHLGKGYGKELVHFAIKYLTANSIQYIWCNARSSALPFYVKQGFEICSNEFMIAGIGPHYQMKLNIK